MDKIEHTDPVNPDYYKSTSGREVIDFIEYFNLNMHLGNAVKY